VFAQIATVITPLFVCAGIGFFWHRWGPPFDTRGVTSLSLTLGMPCLIFSTLTRLEVSPELFGEMALVFGVALLALLAIGYVVVRAFRLPLSSYLPVFTASNTGNMGLPLCLFAFGENGLALAICIFVISSLFSFTVGWSVYAGRLGLDVLYNNPLIYAVAASLVCVYAGIEPPRWVANTTRILSGLAIPLMIISLGVSIAKLRFDAATRTILVSVAKLCAGFGVGLGVAEAFGLTGAARGVLIIECTMPVAVHNYIFAQRFARRPEETASMIMLSTIISLVTLPLLMLVVL